MRVPQVSERIKEAPAQALRGVFAGIGQLLLITDKLRNKVPVRHDVPQAREPEPSQNGTDTAVSGEATRADEAAGAAGTAGAGGATGTAEPTGEPAEAPRAEAKTRDLDKTGNVRLLSGADRARADTAKAQEPAGAEVTTAPQAADDAEVAERAERSRGTEGTREPEAVEEHEGTEEVNGHGRYEGHERYEGSPPLPNYDELSVPSLRARLRNLDVTQVRALAEYEKAHAARPDVITMFERRIAKLEAPEVDA